MTFASLMKNAGNGPESLLTTASQTASHKALAIFIDFEKNRSGS